MKFKKTNVYLNRITVKPKLEDNFDTIHIARDVMVEEAVFMKDRSVFRDYREDTEPFLQKCFDQDMEYAKLAKLFKRDPLIYEKVKECLFTHYVTIINIFDFYCGTSDYPRISMNDITSFAHHT